MRRRICIAIIAFILALIIYHPGRHAKHYDYVKDSEVLNELVKYNLDNIDTNLKTCDYDSILKNNIEISVADIYKSQKFAIPYKGGEFVPKTCRPLYKTAIIIPYRNRQEQLDVFLNYMHHYLQQQLIVYRIFVVEQNDSRPFNRAKLLNYGAAEAMKHNFECLVLHDVDLIPLSSGNIYSCPSKPRHMCSSLDTFRFNLPYLGLFGGAISIISSQFKQINGMSNLFEGWGGEDDDFFTRLEYYNFLPLRFSPEMSKYSMLTHKKELPSKDRFTQLKRTMDRQSTDGLNTLNKNYNVVLKTLYTHLYVK